MKVKLTTRLLAEWLHKNYIELANLSYVDVPTEIDVEFEKLPTKQKEMMYLLSDKLVDLLEESN